MHKIHALRKRNNSIRALLFLAPTLVILLGIVVYPLLLSIMTSFTNRLLTYLHYSYVGLGNYINVLHDSLFWHALGNSLKFTFWNVFGSLIIGLGLALMLNASGKLKGLFRGLLFLPWAVPSIVIAVMFRWLYNDIYGFPNFFLVEHGIISQAINPLASPDLVWTAVLIPAIWNYYPFVMLVFLSVMQSIEPDLYQAAAIDGANRRQTFLHITLPALRPAIAIVVILQFLWSFAEFALIYLLTGGGPADATQTLSVYIYKQGFEAKQLGYSSALGAVMFLILIAFTYFFLRINKKARAEE